MKALNLLTLLLTISFLTLAQGTWLTGLTITPAPPGCGDNISAMTSGIQQCANSTMVLLGVNVNGNNITIDIDDQVFGPCLLALVPFDLNANIGVLPGGTYNLTSNLYANGSFIELIQTTFTVGGGSLTTNHSTTICLGDSVELYGNWQSITGTYSDTTPLPSGCDSVSVTHLTVQSIPPVNLSKTICLGDSIFLSGAWQTTSGTYTENLSTSFGCDSIVNTMLTIQIPPQTTTSAAICSNDSMFVGGAWQNVQGNYFDTYSTSHGCDSVVETQLTVFNTDDIQLSASICVGDSFFVAGAWQTQAGSYTESYVNTTNCDSTVTTNLSVNDKDTGWVNTIICVGDSLYVGGAYQVDSGTYYDYTATMAGCDSVVITNLGLEECNTGIPTLNESDFEILYSVENSVLAVRSINSIPFNVELYDLNGKLVQSSGKVVATEMNLVQISTGVYLVQLFNEFGAVTQKILK